MNEKKSEEKNPILIYLFLIVAVGVFMYFGIDRSKYYTVSFETNGGTKLAHLNLEEGEILERPEDPTSEYCSLFTGWYTDPNFENKYNFNSPVLEDIVLYAGWDNCTRDLDYIKYKVTFNSNGGSSVETQEVFNKQTATVPTEPTHKKCSLFTGWYTDSSLKKKYNFSAPVTSNLTLYAGWDGCTDYTIVNYTVSYNTNGGSSVESEVVNKGYTASQPLDPTKDNCTFAGWYSDSKLKNKYNFNSKVTKNLTLYAKWTNCNNDKAIYTVTFDTADGTKIESQMIEKGGLVKKPKNPTINNCTFSNWYTDESNYSKGYNFNTPVTKSFTLYAHYVCNNIPEVKTYTVTFENLGKYDTPNQYVKENEKATKPSNPTDKWCKFAGWYTDSKYTKAFDFNTPITKDTTIYSKWIECTGHVDMYSITFDANGGEVHGVSSMITQVSSGSTLSMPADPLKDYCSFGGWYKDKELKKAYDFNTPVTSNFTLYAKWQYCTNN